MTWSTYITGTQKQTKGEHFMTLSDQGSISPSAHARYEQRTVKGESEVLVLV